MKNYITLENGEIIDIEKISYQFPFSMLQSDIITYEVSAFIAEKVYLFPINSLEYKVAVNFLIQRSKKIYNIAAIVLLSRKYRINKICVEYINPTFLHFFGYQIQITNFKLSKKYLDKSAFLSSFIKYFPNRLFLIAHHLFFSKNKIEKSVIRAWVDVDEKLHGSVINMSTIYIYPFGINIFRSLNFINHCLKKYHSVSLMGVPYQMLGLIKMCFYRIKKSDLGIFLFEIEAMKKHSKQFNKFREIYTSDEYIPAIYALYQSVDPSIYVVNNCHGIGVYNKYINYQQMIVFNSTQKDYYEIINPKVEYRVKEQEIEKEHSLINNQILSFIYIDQFDLKKFNLFYEFEFQEKILSKLNELSNPNKNKIYIKFHPNRDERSRKKLLNKYKNINSVIKIDDLINFTFINLSSTAYYDFRDIGKVIFIKDDLLTPEKIFGQHISSKTIEELEKIILND